MKRTVLMGLGLVLANNVFAAKIAYIDFNAAIKDETEANKVIGDLEKEKADMLMNEQKKTAEFQKKVDDFKKASPNLSVKAKEEKESALTREMGELQQSMQMARQMANQKEQAALGDLETKNRLLVKSLAEQSGYDVVLNMAAVVFVTPKELAAHDLTKKLVDKYNKTYAIKPSSPAKSEPAKPATEKK